MSLEAGARTDVGRARANNEDAFLAQHPLYAVADGLGGHVGGEVASSLALKGLAEALFAPGEPEASLAEGFEQANQVILESARSDQSLKGMGTTLTALLAEADEAHIVHIGDSRAYLFRDGELRQLTRDDSLRERLLQESGAAAEEIEFLPPKNILTQALGLDDDISLQDLRFDLRPRDRLLLCTDGLTATVPDEAIGKLLQEERAPQAACDRLVEAANDGGGPDNITVIVVDRPA